MVLGMWWEITEVSSTSTSLRLGQRLCQCFCFLAKGRMSTSLAWPVSSLWEEDNLVIHSVGFPSLFLALLLCLKSENLTHFGVIHSLEWRNKGRGGTGIWLFSQTLFHAIQTLLQRTTLEGSVPKTQSCVADMEDKQIPHPFFSSLERKAVKIIKPWVI